MSRPVVCPHCGDELDIPSELRGREVRCASCRNTFTAAADAPAPPRANRAAARPTDASRPTHDDDRAPWDDSPRRKRKGSLTWLWLLLGGGGVLACFGCCGIGIVAFQIDNPEFVTHESQKGRFVASFPDTPLEAQRTGDDGLTRECTESTRELILGTEETYFVHYRDLPAAPVGDDARQETLQAACLRALAAQTPGTREKSRTKLTVGTYPAVDLFLTHPDNSATHVRFILAGKRIYAVGLMGPGLKANSMRLKKFLDEFRITSADSEPERKKAKGKLQKDE